MEGSERFLEELQLELGLEVAVRILQVRHEESIA